MSGLLDFRCFCPSCGAANQLSAPLEPGLQPASCRSCGRPLPLEAPGAARPGIPVTICVVCGDDKLYTRRDFSQKAGCAVIAVGAALVPWTYGLSLAVCALADWLAYRLLPTITVCYVCGSQFRGLPLHPDHRPYDLMTAQTWEARTLTWRRLHDRSTD